MGFFKKREPVELEPLTAEEKERYEAIAADNKSIKLLLDHLLNKQSKVQREATDFWDDVAEARGVGGLRDDGAALRIDRDGKVVKEWGSR